MQELFDSAGNQGHFGLSELVVIFIIKAYKTEKPIAKFYEKSNQDLENAKCHRRMLLTLANIVSQYTGSLVQVDVSFMKNGKLMNREVSRN